MSMSTSQSQETARSETARPAAADGAARTYIDVFAGCGGLSLGLHRAGWQGLFAIEKDPMAFETLEKNLVADDAPYHDFRDWPSWVPRAPLNIVEFLADEANAERLRSLRGQVTLIAGGPPCQGFSVGGIRDGKDQRNQLAYRMLDLVDIVGPDCVLIENVVGIARRFKSKPGHGDLSVAEHVRSLLEQGGYESTILEVDASLYGVPQVRKRVVIVGVRTDLISSGTLATRLEGALESIRPELLAELGLPADRRMTVRDALEDLASGERITCPDSPKFEAGVYTPPTSPYAELMRSNLGPEAVPDSHRYTKHGPRILDLYTKAHDTQPPGRLAKSFLRACGTKKDKKVLLDPEQPSSTITTHPDEFIHYKYPRNVTIREMARLQSFPDDFHFFGRYTINGDRRRFDVSRCSQVGNAVPPHLGQALGMALGRVLDQAHQPVKVRTGLPLLDLIS